MKRGLTMLFYAFIGIALSIIGILIMLAITGNLNEVLAKILPGLFR